MNDSVVSKAGWNNPVLQVNPKSGLDNPAVKALNTDKQEQGPPQEWGTLGWGFSKDIQPGKAEPFEQKFNVN